MNVLGSENFQLKAIEYFFKRFRPIFSYVIKKSWKKLIIAFVLTFAVYYFFINPKLYSKEYTIFLIPVLGNNNDISKLPIWNNLIDEHARSNSNLQKSIFDDIYYSFHKSEFSLTIAASFERKSFEEITDKQVNDEISLIEAMIIGKLRIEKKIRKVYVNNDNALSAFVVSSLLILTLFFFLLLFHSLSGRIYQIKQLKSFGFDILGVIPNSKRIFFLDRPRSGFSEAFRLTYRVLMTAIAKYNDKKRVLITSSFSGEGKSTVSINLAMAAVSFGKRVVIVDCDLRKPSIARKLHMNHNIGLSNFLIDETLDLKNILQTSTYHENLFIITSGPLPPNPSEQIESLRLKKCLDELENIFDLIIIDTTPVLVAEPSFLANVADIIVTVCRLDYSTIENTNETYLGMKKLNNETFMVINGATDIDQVSFGYGYGYGDYDYGNEISFLRKLGRFLKFV